MNTDMTEPQVTRRKRTWLLVAACLVVLGLIAWFTGAIGSRRPVTILRDNAAFENPVARILSKLPSGPRDSLRKLKFRLFGPPKAVTLETRTVAFSLSPQIVSSNLMLGQPALTNDRGLAIWIVPNSQIAGCGVNLEKAGPIPSVQRMTTFSGHQVKVGLYPAGGNGYSVGLLPRVRNQMIDLAMRAEHFSGPTTSLLVTARLNLPKDSGVIVLKQSPTNPTNTIGIFLQPALLQIKK